VIDRRHIYFELPMDIDQGGYAVETSVFAYNHGSTRMPLSSGTPF